MFSGRLPLAFVTKAFLCTLLNFRHKKTAQRGIFILTISRNGRSSRIRTYDPLVPNQVHYQAVLCSECGVNDGIRTRDNWNHNPGLYQLSYIHHNIFLILYTKLPNGAPDRIRTCDHPLRRRMLYPTELQAHNDDNIIKRYFADIKIMFFNIF